MAHFTSALEPPLAPFDACAETYDDVFTDTYVGRAQRAFVWREMDRLFQPGQRVLEINCGTGVDAMHLAEKGLQVDACDASGKMISTARNRISSAGYESGVNLGVLATEELWRIEGSGLFDGALSNFAGLNCLEDLSSPGKELARLLKPGAMLLVCVFGRRCVWEMVWYLARRNYRKAFRRVGGQGALAQCKNGNLPVYYPSIRSLERAFAPYFRLRTLKGVGILVPPSYLEPLAVKYLRALRTAAYLDRALGCIPLIRSLADHVLLTFERVGD